MTFRTRLLISSLAAAAVTLAVAMSLVAWSTQASLRSRIEQTLVSQTRLAADALSRRPPPALADLDVEADALGDLMSARVTFVDADGRVLGDSEIDGAALPAVENHAHRPEIEAARASGLGVATRYSTTVRADLLYVAVPVNNPDVPSLALVRVARPLVEVRDQLAAVRQISLIASGAALATAVALAWGISLLLTRRVRNIAALAERYAGGDLSRLTGDYGRDEIGAVARALGEAIREIGRRAADLESDRARMQAILSGMAEGVLVVNEQGRIQLVNQAARRMLQVPDEPDGRHYLEIVRHPDIAAQLGATLRGAATDGLELALPRSPDVIIMTRSAPFVSATARGAVLVLHDITGLRRADRIRRDFVANVSHELRTPLTAVRGYVEALQEGSVEQAEARRFLDIIGRHTLRMERLVRDLLRLARLDAGQEAVEYAPCPTEALFAGVETELADAISSRKQAVEHRISPEAATVHGDPAKLHDALRNLLENATNYAPEGTRIVMSATRLDGRIVLSVMDEGPGIPEADLPRVFERFYRVDKARSRSSRDPGGTGLGLSIVRHLIELHGGKVAAANRPTGGAIFTVELPAPGRR